MQENVHLNTDKKESVHLNIDSVLHSLFLRISRLYPQLYHLEIKTLHYFYSSFQRKLESMRSKGQIGAHPLNGARDLLKEQEGQDDKLDASLRWHDVAGKASMVL